jgi:hypothetical protein
VPCYVWDRVGDKMGNIVAVEPCDGVVVIDLRLKWQRRMTATSLGQVRRGRIRVSNYSIEVGSL